MQVATLPYAADYIVEPANRFVETCPKARVVSGLETGFELQADSEYRLAYRVKQLIAGRSMCGMNHGRPSYPCDG
jgi:hypothetical protein